MSATRREFLVSTAGAAAFIAAGSSRLLAQDAKAIRLGVIQPQGGACATWGVPITRGAELWVEEVNENGGVLCGDGQKYKFEMLAYDNVCYVPGEELVAARKAILDDGCQFLLQTMTPASRKATAQIVTENKVLSGSYGAGFVSKEYPYLLGSITGIPTSNMIHIGTLLEQYPNMKRIAIVVSSASYGQAAAAYYSAGAEVFKDKGVEIVFNQSYDESAKSDLFGLLTPVLQANPDLIVEQLFVPGEKPLMIEALEQLEYKGAYGSESWPLDLIKQRLPLEPLAGRLFTAFSVEASEPSYNARSHAFYKRYVERHGAEAWTIEAANAFATCVTFEAGLALSKEPTAEAVMEALYGAEQVEHPIFGATKWGGEEIFGVNHHLLTELPVYGLTKEGQFVLEDVVDVHAWWEKNKDVALPVLKSGGQVYT